MFFCISVYLYGLGVRGLGSHICAMCIYPDRIFFHHIYAQGIVIYSYLWYNIMGRERDFQTHKYRAGCLWLLITQHFRLEIRAAG